MNEKLIAQIKMKKPVVVSGLEHVDLPTVTRDILAFIPRARAT